MRQVVRPTSRFRAQLELVDREVEGTSTLVEQGKEVFGTSVFDPYHECDYITFEQDFFQVGGDAVILPEERYLSNGFVSSGLSDEDGSFDDPPVIDISFEESHEFPGISYSFVKDYPVSIRVTTYLQGKVTDQFIAAPDGLEYIDEVHHIQACDRIRFEFLGMHDGNRRLRISRMMLGFTKVFDTSSIESMSHAMSIDPVSSSLPSNKLSMKVLNYGHDYNPDNPKGLWQYFKNGQAVRVMYGAEVGEDVEWVNAAYLFLNDAPTVDGNIASFVANDRLSYMTNVYYKGVWRDGGISLYDLAKDVLEDAGVSAYDIPLSLKSVLTDAPIPNLTHRECLQLIANAGRCVLYCDAKGNVVMRPQVNASMVVADDVQVYRKVGENNTDPREIDYLSTAYSDSEGRFNAPPVIQVDYAHAVTSSYFEIHFGDTEENYAPDFNVLFVRDGKMVKSVNVRGNTETSYVVTESVADYTQVILEILSTNRPYQQISITYVGNDASTDFYLDFSTALTKPSISRTEELKQVDVVTYVYTPQDTIEEIYRAEGVVVDGEKTVQVSYLPSHKITVEVEGGTLINSVVYAETAFLTIRADDPVTIVVKGASLSVKSMTVSTEVARNGEICPVDNPLITNRSVAQAVGEWIGDYYKNRSIYELNFRQDFCLDPNDVIHLQSEFEENIPVRITKIQYNLPGQTGAVTARRLG